MLQALGVNPVQAKNNPPAPSALSPQPLHVKYVENAFRINIFVVSCCFNILLANFMFLKDGCYCYFIFVLFGWLFLFHFVITVIIYSFDICVIMCNCEYSVVQYE